MLILGAVLSDVGCQRKHNEDSACFVNAGKPPDDPLRGVLALVADGMGGHAAGDLASQMTADIIENHYWLEGEDPGEALTHAVLKANRAVFERSGSDESLEGMGTTLTAVVFENWRAHMVHVGDSRLYLLRSGEIFVMSADDSAVMEMVRQGMIDLAAARTHDDKNVILRALGTKPEIEPQRWPEPFPMLNGDRWVLSSDGLHDLVQDEEIKQVVLESDPEVACNRLVDLAKERGGPDNITVIVLRVTTCENEQPGDPGEIPPQSPPTDGTRP